MNMKRTMIRIAAVAALTAAVAGAAACGQNRDMTAKGEAYEFISHGSGTLGHVSVTVDRDKKVKTVEFNDFFLPSDWAPLRPETADQKAITGYTVGDIVVAYTPKEGVDITTLTNADATAENLNDAKNSPSAKKADGTPYKTNLGNTIAASEGQKFFTANKDEAKAYAAALSSQSKKIYRLEFGSEDDKDYTVNFGTAEAPVIKHYKKTEAAPPASGTYNKTDEGNSYWPENPGLGYDKNMANLLAFVKKHGFPADNSETGKAKFVRGEDKVWSVSDVSTGATFTNIFEYYSVAYEAYKDAVGKLK